MARLLTLLLVAVLVLTAAPAQADDVVVRDPRGDASGPLDVTRAHFDNGRSRLVVTLRVAEVERGHALVSVGNRGGRGVVLASLHRPGGTDKSFVVDGSFADGIHGRIDCPGFRARWDQRASTVRMSMPARCLAHAEYGDLRFVVLTEDPDGGDSDVVVDSGTDDYRPTKWLARG